MSDYYCVVYILFISLVVSSFTSVSGNIHQKLHYFETLKSSDLHIITKRSIDANPQSHLKFVHLKGLGREFNFYLRSSQNILTGDFKATTVDADGNESPLTVNKNAFFEGALQDEDNSNVGAVWEGDDLLATITTPEDTYTVEPSWRHLPGNENHTMIIYKGSDVISFRNKSNPYNQQFCGDQPGVTLSKEEYQQSVSMTKLYHQSHFKNSSFKYGQEEPDTSHHHHRARRSVLKLNTCDMIIVADYPFYEAVGNKNSLNTANYLIHILTKVDYIYRNTIWDEELNLRDFGVKIRQVRIHEHYTKDSSNSDSYNKKLNWKYKDLLSTFSWDIRFNEFCLAHLFTHQKFEDGVLGLAYISSDRPNTVGGICSSLYYHTGLFMSLNTGWSSSMNTQGHRILTQEAQIVTTHEIGHNWGSEHDPGEGICSPSSFDNGKYLMYPYAVAGYESNNWKFSPCSKAFISKVLLAKSQLCFTAEVKFNFCGNGKVELQKNEECDIGFLVNTNIDKCCTKQCQFSPGAECSPMNHECCTKECHVTPKGDLCRSVVGDSSDCLRNSSCTGQSFNCPKPEAKPDDTPCLDGGKCLNGKCLSFCEARNLWSCICDNVTDSCLRCCFSNDRKCKPYDKHEELPDGRPCVQGYCFKGVCKKVVRNVIQRLFDIIEKIMTDDFGEFMKSNIVTAVIIFSMFLWIPLSCFISHYDKKQRLNEERKETWNKPTNRSFYSALAPSKLKIQAPGATRQITPVSGRSSHLVLGSSQPLSARTSWLDHETTL